VTGTCTEQDVMAALILLHHTMPGQHPDLSERTAVVWHQRLALYPAEVVQHVALHWAGDRYPSAEEFRHEVSAEQRRRADEHADRQLAAGDKTVCAACAGTGFQLLSDKQWICQPCPEGCEPPLPRHRREKRRGGGHRSGSGPQRVDGKRAATGEF
jgi:hypothetical protein